jgi:uncharacterized membrane protein YfcA
MKTLIPAWSVLSVVVGLDILRRDYDKIAWADLMPLIPSCLLGIVLGLAFYKALDSPTLTRGLGLLVVLYGAFSLRATMRPPQEWQIPPKSIARLSGLIGGAVGTTFGALTSLSFAVYFDAIRMPVDQFRGTMSAALVAMGFVRALGYFGLAEFTADVWLLFWARCGRGASQVLEPLRPPLLGQQHKPAHISARLTSRLNLISLTSANSRLPR